jgi:membrane carboxypeptidase/penicillin-binding protein
LGIARAYGTFARGGVTPGTDLVRQVIDGDGNVLERHISPGDVNSTTSDMMLAMWDAVLEPSSRRLAESTMYITTGNMLQVVKQGTATRARKLEHAAAGKTGTLPFDVWFAGFTKTRTAVAWVGADRMERPLGKSIKDNLVYGGDTALPAWLGFMSRLDIHRPQRKLPSEDTPKDVEHFRIDPTNGLYLEKGGMVMPHRLGTEPEDSSFDALSPENIEALEGEF